ncbi:hypothetical protein ABVK25_008859 [Lepraria finkii]|uniref:Cytochrome P450 n=1 Tax=Lepraria finkii TaxID=1340010 RepID=A0ABR4B4S2_9LECA
MPVMETSRLLAMSVAVLALFVSYRYYAFRYRMPPGPRGLPIIGSLHQAPSKYPWRTFADWHKKYGPIYSLQFGPTTLVMLGTHDAARDLLDKRSNIYSSRPKLFMVGEIIGKGFRTLLLPYGPRWRIHHRLHASVLNQRIAQTYHVMQDLESKQLIAELLTRSDFSDRFHRYASSVVLSLAYGKRMPRGDESEIKSVDEIMIPLNAALASQWIVDVFPFLNALPGFLAPWKKHGENLHKIEADFLKDVMDRARKTPSWNWSKELQSMKESDSLCHTELAYILGVVYEAGSDTVSMVLETFVMAAVLHPAVVQKAHEELDRVVGRGRLPTFDDLDRLPYVHAIVKETHRWRPVIPGGVPHAVDEDDEYMGYHIPKGAVVLGNHWAIHLDPDVYEKPMDFNPERWIEHPDLPLAGFGFGRRKCVGQYVGTNSLLINVARMLWAYDIEYAYEERHGRKVRCEVDPFAFTNGFNSGPLRFKAQFSVRSAEAEEIMKREWNDAEKNVDVLLDGIRDT